MNPLSPEQIRDLALLAWQVELGADEAIGDVPVNRFAVAATARPAKRKIPVPEPVATDLAGISGCIAVACTDLPALRSAMAEFEGCALKRGARNLVFSDGNPAARVMIIGEAPGREEDVQGKPFVGRSGQLLDKMLAAIGLSRGADDPEDAVYITNVLPWRPPQNRDPSSDEISMMKPFLLRHVALVAPQVIVTMGNPATRTVLDTTTGIMRLRGKWQEFGGVPLLPMMHPAALLRTPSNKRLAWDDLRALRQHLDQGKGN